MLTAEPADGPLWQPRVITVRGATPGALVTIRAETLRDGSPWSSQATFLADRDGVVDLPTSAPVSGDYRSASAMGLFWSQERDSPGTGSPEPRDPDQAIVTRLTAREEPGTGFLDAPGGGARGNSARTEVSQWLRADGVEREELDVAGLPGTLFRPPGRGPHPTVLIFNGSGGGIPAARAALYASRGIQALALGYFRAPGLSRYISRTPLEYFERSLNHVRSELRPAGGRPAVSGQSRGGELSLLLAATFPDQISAVAAFVPAAFAFGAQGAADPADGWSGPTWTRGGVPLEHLWHDNSEVTWNPWGTTGAPSRHADVYVDGLRERRLAAASRIPIERFSGPVACVSGLDDRAWPSSMASRMVLSSLERAGHAAERLHLDYEDAGHGIGLPHLPSTDIERIHPVSGVRYSNGGTPRGAAHASVDSFEQITAFLLRAPSAVARHSP